jgi:hypothetical protein
MSTVLAMGPRFAQSDIAVGLRQLWAEIAALRRNQAGAACSNGWTRGV